MLILREFSFYEYKHASKGALKNIIEHMAKSQDIKIIDRVAKGPLTSMEMRDTLSRQLEWTRHMQNGLRSRLSGHAPSRNMVISYK